MSDNIRKFKNFNKEFLENKKEEMDNIEDFYEDNKDFSEDNINEDEELALLWRKEKGDETEEILNKIKLAMEDSQAYDYNRKLRWLIEFTGDEIEAKRILGLIDSKIEENEEEVKDKDDDKNKKETKYEVSKDGPGVVKKTKEEEEIQDFDLYNNSKEEKNTEKCKVLIINGCEDNEKLDSITGNISKNIDDCDEIHLYQLNIKDVNSSKEPKDGMDFIYKELESCDGLILACDKMSDNMKTLMKRIKMHYSEGELKNKILGLVSDSFNETDNILKICLDLGMILCGDCFCDVSDETETDSTNLSVSLVKLCDSTKDLREMNLNNDEILDYDSYEVNKDELESDNEEYHEYKEDGSDDSLKDIKNEISKDLEEDQKDIEEEEERLIDNLDGSITHIHNNKLDTNPKKGEINKKLSEEEEDVKNKIPKEEQSLPFSSFDLDKWKKMEKKKWSKNVDVEEGKMKKTLGLKKGEKITDKYTSGKELAEDLMDKIKDEKEVTGMLAFAANIDTDHNIFDKALKHMKNINGKNESKLNEYNYDEWKNIEEDEEDYEPMDFDEYSNSETNKDECLDINGIELFVGDYVKVDDKLTTDPYEKRGEVGEIIKLKDDFAVLYFDTENGDIGKYKCDALEKM